VKIVQITTVHHAFDIRIFRKECITLARACHNVILIAPHEKNEIVDGVRIVALSKPKNRLSRIFGLTWRALSLARAEHADVYHFHDPELLLIGLLLKVFTKGKVIYDVHEDHPQEILTKDWIPTFLRFPIFVIFSKIEMFAARFFDQVVVVTERIAENFAQFNPIIIHNYPDLKILPIPSERIRKDKEKTFVFIGGISKLRGALEMVLAFECLDPALDGRLDLMGRFEPKNLEAVLQDLPGYDHVRFLGRLAWAEAWKKAQDAIAGLVLYHPVPNHIESQPNKIFEYMAAGLPVIASNFPLWKEIIEGSHCGLTVDPLKPKQIADAIEYLIMHPDEGRKMGENGNQAVREKYNWGREGEKLVRLYEETSRR